MVRHEHKGKTEKDESKLQLNVVLKPIKVQIINLYIFVLLKYFDGLLGILRVQVDSNYFFVFFLDFINNCPKGLTGTTANVQEIALRQRHFADETEMSSYGKEETDEQIVYVGRKFLGQLQHQIILFIKIESMKGDMQNIDQPKQQKKLGILSPQQQAAFLKEQIGKRIKKNQMQKIKNMSLSEVNEIIDKQIQPPMDTTRINQIRLLNMKLGVTQDMAEHGIKTPGQKHLEMIEKSEMLRKYKLREITKDPIMAQIKRGKLGMDNFFIFFGIFGSLMIPLYVYNKFKKNRQAIVNSRIASPEVIKRLDEDSPIDLDDVSYHTIHYYNPDRIKEDQLKKKRIEQRIKLEKQLYF